MITRDGKKSLMEKDWLTSLNFRVADTNIMSEYNNSINNINSNNNKIEVIEISPELRRIKQKFPKIFSRQGKIVGHTIQIEFKEGAKATQQKGEREPLQLQKAVDAERKNLIKSGQIERVDKLSDEMFIQPVVIAVKKDRSIKIALVARSLNNANLKKILNAKPGQFDGKESGNREWQTRRRGAIHITGHAIRIRTNNPTSGHSKTWNSEKTIRTDPATIVRSKRFKEFYSKRLIQHIECPLRTTGKRKN